VAGDLKTSVTALYAAMRDALRRGEPVTVRRSSEYAALIVNAMATNEPCVIYGNVRNVGLIPNLPADACVEVPCLVDANGVRGVPVPDYPAELAALNRTYLNPVELTVRAVLESRPDLVRIAALLDPNASASLTLDEIDDVVDELLAAHADALPAGLRGNERQAA